VSPPASGNAYRRSFLDEIMPIPDHHQRAADVYPMGIAGITGRVRPIPEVLGSYRKHGGNMSESSGTVSLRKLHHMIEIHVWREAMQAANAPRYGFCAKPDRLRFLPGMCKQRLISLRLRPDLHPVRSDSVARLLLAGVWGSLIYDHMPARKRLASVCGFLALAVAPRSMLKRHLDLLFAARCRGRILGFLLNDRRRPEQLLHPGRR
jgi:hypothetical protein